MVNDTHTRRRSWTVLHFGVSDAVRMNPVCKPEVATDNAIDRVVGMWLVNARDREGGRKCRFLLAASKRNKSLPTLPSTPLPN